MKKLLAMVGAVALGAFAWADDVATYTGTDFEAYTAGEATTQAEDNLYYWLPSADTAATATVVEGSSGGNEQIGEWSASDDAQVLKIKTNLTKPLYRSVLGSEELTALSGKSMTDVVFIDAMVKFTSCDEPVEIDENGKLASDSDAKLAVWVLENVEDTDKPTTNLYVTAGFFGDNGLVAKSYDCGPVKDYDIALDGFNRLTVRSIVDITDAGDPGFVVFVNGKPVASEDERGAITYGKVATAWRKKGNVIFPSIDNESLVKDTICGVGFAGQGEVDNITFAKSEESRDFALQPQADVMTVNFSEHVAGVTLTPAKGDAYTVTDADISAGTCVFEVTSESSPVEIAVTFEEGWKSAKAWTTVNSTVELDGNTGTVTFSLDSENLPAVTIVEKSAKVAATVGGEEFDTLAAAIAYVNGLGEGDPVLVKIGDDVASSASEDNNICIDSECARDVVIDLNGKTIYGKNINDGEFLYGVIENDGGNLTIIDSAGGGKVVADATVVEGAAQPSVYMYAGTTVISNGIFVGKALVETAENPTVTIAGGSFDAESNSTEDDPAKFALDSQDYIPEDKVATLKDGYWVVETPEVKTGSVIFVCEAAGVNVQVDDLKVGEVIPEDKIPGSTKSYLKITQWSEDLASWTVVEDTTTITGTADINLDKDADGAYEVAEAADLVVLKDYVNAGNDCAGKTFKQTADIDMKDAGLWKGIGNKAGTLYFGGIYDGNDKKIENVTFDAQGGSSNSYMGFFRYVKNGTIKDLTVESDGFGNLPTAGFGGDYEYGGAVIVGYAENATLSGLTAEGQIGTQDDPTTHNAGGIAVCAIASKIENCVNNATLYCGYSKASGIVVFTNPSKKVADDKVTVIYDYDHGTVISGCRNEGTIIGIQCWKNAAGTRWKEGDGEKKSFKDVAADGYAGILAWTGDTAFPSAITNCSNTASITTDVSGADHKGGFIGEILGEVSNKVIGSGNVGRTGMPLVGTINADATKATDFLYTVDGAQPATLAANGTFTIEVAHEKSGYSQGKVAPVLALATDETVTFITNKCTYVVDFAGITASAQGDEIKEEVVAGGVKFTAAASAPQGWPENPEDVKGQAAGDVYGETLPAALAKADAATVATWAKVAGNVAFADKANINTDAFLLNIDNASTPEQIQAAKDAFKITSFAQASDGTWVVTLTDQKGGTIYAGGTYGNGMVVVESFSDVTCTTPATEGDQLFYKAKLVVKEVEPQPVQ